MFDLVLFSFHHKFLCNKIVMRSCINSIKFHNLCVTVRVGVLEKNVPFCTHSNIYDLVFSPKI